jgi:hypothetical protein
VAPFAVLLFILKNNIRPHYASLDLLPVFAGCWAIFGVWITLHKGIGSLLLGGRHGQRCLVIAWAG